MTELIMMVGLPASGKSTYAKSYEEKGYHVHSSDEIRKELNGGELVWNTSENRKVFEELHRRIKEDLMNGISCVYDATNFVRKNRMSFLREIANIPCKKTAIIMLAPVSTCIRRNRERDNRVEEGAYDRLLRAFQMPAMYEGWNNIVTNLTGYDEAEMYSLTLKEPDELTYFEQDNPHHKETLGAHMALAYRYAKDRHASDYVKNAAKYHDCGKVYTKSSYDSNGNRTQDAHYYGHENVGAYMYLYNRMRKLCDATYFTPEQKTRVYKETIYETLLINWHMRPFLAWNSSPKAAAKDRKLVGERMYADILALHEADKAAH